MMELGDWIRKERNKRRFSQNKFANFIGTSQATLSLWETNKTLPTIHYLNDIVTLFGMTLRDVPFECIELNKVDLVMERMSLYELPGADTIKTFEGKTYELKGFIGVEVDSGEIERVTDLYYRTRTVVTNDRVMAKRKKPNDELMKVKAKKLRKPK